ncbi:MAG TPA: tetratricopeptide repeat protein [Candidatus Dormibacteraeota bacterium]
MPMVGLPEGTLTFFFTDLEGSTKTWETAPATMRQAMARHDQIVASVTDDHHGVDVHSGRAGDSTLTVFRRATDAVACALRLQRAFNDERWPEGIEMKIRVALHTGEAELRGNQYYGQPLNRCARLLATGYGGQILLTQATEELVVDELPVGASLRDLGFHRLKDLSRAEHVFELVDLEHPRQFPPIRSMRRESNNLPFQLTSFIGREADLQHLQTILPELRLLTLTGPAGAGKTRLAVQLAWRSISQFPDGVWLVELGGVADHDKVPQQLADVLELREQPGRPLMQTLREQLADRRLLLVLDSCEHVVGAAAQLVMDLLQHSERLSVVATSREPLRVSGEVLHRVASLEPEPALQLFATRARLNRPSFEISDENVEVIARICQRLDGLPLAIELAAARVQMMSVEEILQRLEERFSLLTGGDRTASGRLRTLRAAIDWSYDLLGDEEQRLFRRICIFADRFSLEAVERVCTDKVLKPAAILSNIDGLADKSMVVVDDGRYRCLESVRAYGRDRLRELGEREQLNLALARYLLERVERREPGQLAAWLDLIETLHDDLVAIMGWSLEYDLDLGARIALSLYIYWQLRGHATEPREFAEALLRRVDVDFKYRAAMLHLAGAFAYVQGDVAGARRRLDEALTAARDSGDHLTELRSLETSGLLEVAAGNVTAAEAVLEEALHLSEEQGQPPNQASILHQLGLVASRRGEQPRARSLFERSIEIRRSLGRADEASMPLTFLAAVALLEGDLETSRRSIAEALQIGVALRDRRAAWSLEVLACISALEGEQQRAVRLAGAAAAMHEAAGNRPPEGWQQFVNAVLKPARGALGEEAASAAWEAGQRLTMDQVFDLAVESGSGHTASRVFSL